MISLGLIGSYIGRIYDEIKGRPRYLVSEIATSDIPFASGQKKSTSRT